MNQPDNESNGSIFTRTTLLTGPGFSVLVAKSLCHIIEQSFLFAYSPEISAALLLSFYQKQIATRDKMLKSLRYDFKGYKPFEFNQDVKYDYSFYLHHLIEQLHTKEREFCIKIIQELQRLMVETQYVDQNIFKTDIQLVQSEDNYQTEEHRDGFEKVFYSNNKKLSELLNGLALYLHNIVKSTNSQYPTQTHLFSDVSLPKPSNNSSTTTNSTTNTNTTTSAKPKKNLHSTNVKYIQWLCQELKKLVQETNGIHLEMVKYCKFMETLFSCNFEFEEEQGVQISSSYETTFSKNESRFVLSKELRTHLVSLFESQNQVVLFAKEAKDQMFYIEHDNIYVLEYEHKLNDTVNREQLIANIQKLLVDNFHIHPIYNCDMGGLNNVDIETHKDNAPIKQFVEPVSPVEYQELLNQQILKRFSVNPVPIIFVWDVVVAALGRSNLIDPSAIPDQFRKMSHMMYPFNYTNLTLQSWLSSIFKYFPESVTECVASVQDWFNYGLTQTQWNPNVTMKHILLNRMPLKLFITNTTRPDVLQTNIISKVDICSDNLLMCIRYCLSSQTIGGFYNILKLFYRFIKEVEADNTNDEKKSFIHSLSIGTLIKTEEIYRNSFFYQTAKLFVPSRYQGSDQRADNTTLGLLESNNSITVEALGIYQQAQVLLKTSTSDTIISDLDEMQSSPAITPKLNPLRKSNNALIKERKQTPSPKIYIEKHPTIVIPIESDTEELEVDPEIDEERMLTLESLINLINRHRLATKKPQLIVMETPGSKFVCQIEDEIPTPVPQKVITSNEEKENDDTNSSTNNKKRKRNSPPKEETNTNGGEDNNNNDNDVDDEGEERPKRTLRSKRSLQVPQAKRQKTSETHKTD